MNDQNPPDAKRTYGYARLEALGAMINGGMLFVVAGYILWEAVGRFREPPHVATNGMLIVVKWTTVSLNSAAAQRENASSAALEAT